MGNAAFNGHPSLVDANGSLVASTAKMEKSPGETAETKTTQAFPPELEVIPPRALLPVVRVIPPRLVPTAPSEPRANVPPMKSCLAMRRKVAAGLHIAADRLSLDMKACVSDPTSGASRSRDTSQKPTKKSIKNLRPKEFSGLYKLGREVMPSTNAGMQVLFAKRISDGEEVVVKTRDKAESFGHKTAEKEWRRSTEMLLNLPVSDNIARVYEVLEDESTYYIVMEKCDGVDLFESAHESNGLPMVEVREILRQLLIAVRDLHSRGCIHKDLKLENVMVGKALSTPSSPLSARSTDVSEPGSPKVKLIDFDTVELFMPKHRARSVAGTDQYIAQEAYAGHYSPASDIFSVGVIAYKLISGRFPFKSSMFDDKPGENWVGSPKMKSIQDRLNHFSIDWSRSTWVSKQDARDLTRWMLQMKQLDRPTAQQALDHAFFKSLD